MNSDEKSQGISKPGYPEASIAFGDMYQAEAPKLARFFRRRLPQVDQVKDFVHEVFIRFLRSSPTAELKNPEAYLQRIARNLVVDTFRKSDRQTRSKFVSLDETDDIAVPAGQSDWLDAEAMFQRYKSALADLPYKTREVFLLHRVDELSYEQIAIRLGISVGTVKYHMTKALVHLDEALNHE